MTQTQFSPHHQDLIATGIILHDSQVELDSFPADKCTQPGETAFTMTTRIVEDYTAAGEEITVINTGVIIHEAAPDCSDDLEVINTGVVVHDTASGNHHPRVQQTGIIIHEIAPEPTE